MKLKVGTRIKIIGNGNPIRHHLEIGTVARVVESDAVSVFAEGKCEIGGTTRQWVSNADFIVCNKAVIL